MSVCGCVDRPCGCCDAPSGAIAPPPAQLPGQPILHLRRGDHAAFFDAVLARLSTTEIAPDRTRPLAQLGTRDVSDPTVALVDAWAVGCDLLTFYLDRYVQEGYLRTATQRRSLVELGRLVGYRPRPGVAASTWVSFTVDAGPSVVVPAGTRLQSLPGQGEQPQTFETVAPVTATRGTERFGFSTTRPQLLDEGTATIWFAGAASRLAGDDRLLVTSHAGTPWLAKVTAVRTDTARDELAADVVPWTSSATKSPATPPTAAHPSVRGDVSALPISFLDLERRVPAEQLSDTIAALRAQELPSRATVAVFRQRAGIWGANLPAVTPPIGLIVADGGAGSAPVEAGIVETGTTAVGEPGSVKLDSLREGIAVGSWVVIATPTTYTWGAVERASPIGVLQGTIPGRITQLDVRTPEGLGTLDDTTTIYAAPEPLALARCPWPDPVGGDSIALDDVYPELRPGMRLAVAGEQLVDVASDDHTVAERSGRAATTVVTVEAITYDRELRALSDGDADGTEEDTVGRVVATLKVDRPLGALDRLSAVAYGNLAVADHGESRREVLANGDASVPHQTGVLRQGPTTWTPAPVPGGVRPALTIAVDGQVWRGADDALDVGPDDRAYVRGTEADGRTSATFGYGARPTTGVENVVARYRIGLGVAGNVDAGRLSLLLDKPPGVRGVSNPVRASGGADADGAEAIRVRIPLAVGAPDRLVSADDYERFAVTFAGIGKAVAALVATTGGPVVQVTVAGIADGPLDTGDELLTALRDAVRTLGDPTLRVDIAIRRLRPLRLAADVRIDADRVWETTRDAIVRALVRAVGFDAAALGRPFPASAVLAAIYDVPGVTAVRLTRFTDDADGVAARAEAAPASVAADGSTIAPAELTFLDPARPGALELRRWNG